MTQVHSNKINCAIVGVGSCASALVQGVEFYKGKDEVPGVMFPDIGGYRPDDIKFVAAWDVDERKVGYPLTESIFAKPNCCIEFNTEFDDLGPVVLQGPELDGVARHMSQYPADHAFRPARAIENFLTLKEIKSEIVHTLRSRNVDVLLNYLPVGSQTATEFWMECCLEAGVAVVNCIPVFIASDPEWAQRFAIAGVPIIGDDMRSQFGASIVSAVLQELAFKRGHDVQIHYQDNVGGNTDFLNMQDQGRLQSKKVSKENVIKRQNDIAGKEVVADSIAAGPAKYFPALGDNKRAHWLIQMTGFGGAKVEFTADLSVQDSPNSAGVVIDAIRFLRVARELGIVGPIFGPSAFTQKTPPIDMRPNDAWEECNALAARKVPQLQRDRGSFRPIVEVPEDLGTEYSLNRLLKEQGEWTGLKTEGEIQEYLNKDYRSASYDHHKVIENNEVGIPPFEEVTMPIRPVMPPCRDIKEHVDPLRGPSIFERIGRQFRSGKKLSGGKDAL